MKYFFFLSLFLSSNIFGQKISTLNAQNILITANKSGIDSAFSLLHQRNGYFYLDLIDTSLVISLCTYIEDLDLNRSKFSTHFLIRTAEVLHSKVINKQLLKLANKYQGVYTLDGAYQEYPNYEIFKAIASQRSMSSVPLLQKEIDYWKHLQSNFTDTGVRNFKIVKTLNSWLNDVIMYIEDTQSTNKTAENVFFINKQKIKGRQAISNWDTVSLLHKTLKIQDIELNQEPYFIKHFDYANFLSQSSEIEIIHDQNKAIICLRNNTWSAIYQMVMLSEREIAVRFLTGGIE